MGTHLRTFARRLGWRLNLLLLGATALSTTLCGGIFFGGEAGSVFLQGSGGWPAVLSNGLSYSLPVLLILGAHEMGHYAACRRHAVGATLPYFIPAPFLFGTMGAVIRMRPPIPGRRALFDIGIAGPLAGFIVAVPVLAVGVATSRVEPLPSAPGEIIVFGYPPLVSGLVRLFHGALAPGVALVESPAMMAGWFGMLITAMNLFPVGQLDGGHITYALSPGLHRVASLAAAGAMVALVAFELGSVAPAGYPKSGGSSPAGGAAAAMALLAYAAWSRLPRLLKGVAFGVAMLLIYRALIASSLSPWLLWTVVLLALRRAPHPPLSAGSSDEIGIGAGRTVLAASALLVFGLCFAPTPLRIVLAPS